MTSATRTKILPAQVTVVDCENNFRNAGSRVAGSENLSPGVIAAALVRVKFRIDFFIQRSGYKSAADAYKKITNDIMAATKTSTSLTNSINNMLMKMNPSAPPLTVETFSPSSEEVEEEIQNSPQPTSQPTRIVEEPATHQNTITVFVSGTIAFVVVILFSSYMFDWISVTDARRKKSKRSMKLRPDADMMHYSQESIDEATSLIASAVPCMAEDPAALYDGDAPSIRGNIVVVKNNSRQQNSVLDVICFWRGSNLFSQDVWRNHRWLGLLFFQPERSRLLLGVERGATVLVVLLSACLCIFVSSSFIKAELLGSGLPLWIYVTCFAAVLCVIAVAVGYAMAPLVRYCFSSYFDMRKMYLPKGSKVLPRTADRFHHTVDKINSMFENEGAFSAGGDVAGASYDTDYVNGVLSKRMTYDDYMKSIDGEDVPPDSANEHADRRRNAKQSVVDYSKKIQEDVASCRSALLALAAPATIRSLDKLILEFDEVWGLDIDGKFSEDTPWEYDDDDDDDESFLSICWRYCCRPPVKQSSFQALVADLFSINQKAIDERNRAYFTFRDDEDDAVLVKRRKRLIQLFLLDTMPPLSAAIVNSQIQRSQDSIPPPFKPINAALHYASIIFFCFIVAGCIGLAYYIGTILNNHEQSMVLYIFLLWLLLDVFLTSSCAVIIKHVLFPLIARYDMKSVMFWLINAVDKRHVIRSSAGKPERPLIAGEMCDSAAPSWLTLDASKHFFVSTRLALLLEDPRLEREAILSFKTLWPKRSYGSTQGGSMYEYNQMTTLGYTKYPAQWLQNPYLRKNKGVLIGYFYYFLSLLLLKFYDLSVPLQDVVMDLSCGALIHGMMLLHYWLYLLQPTYIVLPLAAGIMFVLLGQLVHTYFFVPPGDRLSIIEWLAQAWCCCFRPTAFNWVSPTPTDMAAPLSPQHHAVVSMAIPEAAEGDTTDLSDEVANRVAKIKLERAKAMVTESAAQSAEDIHPGDDDHEGYSSDDAGGFADLGDSESDQGDEDLFGDGRIKTTATAGADDVSIGSGDRAGSARSAGVRLSAGIQQVTMDGRRAQSADFGAIAAHGSAKGHSVEPTNRLHSNTSGRKRNQRRSLRARANRAAGGVESPSNWFDRADSSPLSNPSSAGGSFSPIMFDARNAIKEHPAEDGPAVVTSVDKWLQITRETDLKTALGTPRSDKVGLHGFSPTTPQPQSVVLSPSQKIAEKQTEDVMPSVADFLGQVASQNIMLNRSMTMESARSPVRGGSVVFDGTRSIDMAFSDSDEEKNSDDQPVVITRVGNRRPRSVIKNDDNIAL